MSTSIEGETLHCARHPNTETVLRCGRCDTPICARCMIMSPVGARCRTCAQVKRFAVGLKPAELVKAIGYGIGLSAIGTIIVTFIPFLGLFGYAAIGFGVGEVVSIGANRKRVPALAPIAVACLFIGYFVGGSALLASRGVPLSVAISLQVASLFSLTIVGLLIGALLAWMRVR
ncbi:MAG TPA: hypothetical protein VGJ60_26145 [Chloroflexota bacterium]|jgi:hypothetical protein